MSRLVQNMQLMKDAFPSKEVWDKLSMFDSWDKKSRYSIITDISDALRQSAGRKHWIGGEFKLEWSLFRRARRLVNNDIPINSLHHSYQEMIEIFDTAIRLAKLQTFG
jgi:hypothetical protein